LNIVPIGFTEQFALSNSVGNNPAKPGEAGGGDFSAILSTFAKDTVSALQNGEQTAIDAIQGKTSIQNAVMATMEAEQSLQAALAIRDKVVSAFLEISRMQV
jgi:flagellar hook-basal body complex protein FliE